VPPAPKTPRTHWHWLLAGFFIVAGANHFLHPAPYLAMMPRWLPAHSALIAISGVAEVLGGVGVLFRSSRRFAGWGLLLLIVAVFPANVQVALHGWPGYEVPAWMLWLRLPLQLLALWWVYQICIAGSRPGRTR